MFGRRPDPLAPPLTESERRYYLRIYGGGLALCLVGIVAGFLMQRVHYRGQAGLILAILSGVLGVMFGAGLTALPPRRPV